MYTHTLLPILMTILIYTHIIDTATYIHTVSYINVHTYSYIQLHTVGYITCISLLIFGAV